MLDPSTPNTVSQLVGVVLMLAPSASDNHLENHSGPVFMFRTYAACEQNAEHINQQHILPYRQEIPDMTEDTSSVHAWCKGVYK